MTENQVYKDLRVMLDQEDRLAQLDLQDIL